MHGLNTIKELNELAYQNSNADKLLKAASEKTNGQPSPLALAAAEVVRKREESRQAAIDALNKESTEALISRVDALEYPNALEIALRNRLASLNTLVKNEEHY